MTCKRKGCKKPVLRQAVLHGDVYCSTTCFRLDYGTATPEEVAVESSDQGWRAASQESQEREAARSE